MQTISVERVAVLKPKPQDENELGFGRIFTDHMFLMDYDAGVGWHDARIVPFAPIPLSPAAMCLHYGQEIFEGMKAYRAPDGGIRLFRPELNMERLNLSGNRLCIPPVDEAFAVEAVRQLVRMDADWVPRAEGASLYIRPFIFAADEQLGVHPAKHLIFSIILSPVGAYFPGGLDPVKIYVEQEYVRAVRGGMGYTKTAGNYAASLKAQEKANAAGYSQVLWLDGIEHKYIEEVGAMNVFFVLGDTVVTPALQGSILGGITRRSCLELLQSWGVRAEERPLALAELMEGARGGRLKEAFGSGTAAVISPIGALRCGEEEAVINGSTIGSLTRRLYDALTGIQWGRAPDPFGWSVAI
ncbi:MAG: branched-chain amino acid aminotransferase [Oscillospiraceae bacterium]|jgi:branched-chain amino acid aminotransferase|nr:branched-chain amino acid aminotransferase [Oscillospiraceae bacterium]